MKVCKKCKKKVTNKSKICKYCGADVSRAKIIPSASSSNKSKEKEKIENKEKLDVLKNNNSNEIVSKTENKPKKENKPNNKKQKSIKENNLHNKKSKTNKGKSKLKTKIINILKKITKKKIILLVLAIIIIFLSITYCYINSNENKIVEGKENQKTVFNINETINYKDVYYTVKNVEVSMGTEYKHPAKGNEYIVVTVEYENKTDEKVRYSYKDWKMSNSKGEEKKRIFVPVKAESALYTGKLVVGGIKSGTMVFEQPIGDEKLELHFYEHIENKTDEKPNEKVEEKPIFTIKIPKLTNSKTKKKA